MTVYVDMNQLAEIFPLFCLSRLSELSPLLGVKVDHKQMPRQV